MLRPGNLPPRIAQRHRTVEYRLAGLHVDAVGDEVAVAFELEALFGLRVAQSGFDIGADDLFRVGIQCGFVVLAAAVRMRIGE